MTRIALVLMVAVAMLISIGDQQILTAGLIDLGLGIVIGIIRSRFSYRPMASSVSVQPDKKNDDDRLPPARLAA